jgi:hypothetical protein
MNKGFEVTFRNETVKIAVNEHTSMSVLVQTFRGEHTISVGGLMLDTMLFHCWLFAYDLKLGDEIIIERKEVEQSSEPVSANLFISASQGGTYKAAELTAEEEEKILKCRLKYFHSLENKLKEEGLI